MKYLGFVLASLLSLYAVEGFFVTGVDGVNPFNMNLDLIGLGRELATRLGIRFQNRNVQYGPKIEPFFKTFALRTPQRANVNLQNEVKNTIGDFEVRPGFPFGRYNGFGVKSAFSSPMGGYQSRRPNYQDKYYNSRYSTIGKSYNFNMGPLRFRVKKYFGMPRY